MKRQLLGLFAAFCGLSLATEAQIVLNEINFVTGPNAGQFVELYGPANQSVDGHALVVVKSSFSGGDWTATVQDVVDLQGQTLDSEGFLLLEGEGWQNTVAGVVLTAQPASEFELNASPVFTGIADAVLYGNTSVTNPQMAAIVALVNPDATGTVYEGGEGVNAGSDGLSRVPDGGAALDQQFVMQALSPGSSNVLGCEGGHLSLNGSVTTFCTDLGPQIVGFTHESDAASAATSLVVLESGTDVVVEVFLGTAIDMEGLGDGSYDVVAVSHNAILDASPATLADVGTSQVDGCVSLSDEVVTLQGQTCEIPSCDGGTILTAGAEPDAQACLLAEDGALVSFGYFSDAAEDEYVFLICNTQDSVLATTHQPFFDFAAFEEAGDYHVWGLSYQDSLVDSTVAVGSWVYSAAAYGCDSLSSNFLEVNILQCGEAGLCDDLIISEYIEGTSNNKALEVHNPTVEAIDLTPYTMEVYNNGASSPTQELDLEGTIPPGGVHVMGNPQADAAIVNQSQVLSSVTWFNGNDAIVLRKNGVVIDQMGEIGPENDPGEPDGWAVQSGGMSEYTLVRKPNIGQGSTNWAEGQTEWDVYPQDTFDFLGEHEASCGGLGTMVVGFAAPELYVAEGQGVAVEMVVSYPLEDVEVLVEVSGGDAEPGADFPAVFPLSFEFEAGLLNSQAFNFVAVDEEDPELQEDVELTLTVVSGGAVVGIETVVIHILPSDLEYPVYDIIQVRDIDNQGVLDSIDTACELRGVVHGWNDYPQGLRFTLIDPTSGINVFSAINNFGYEVVEGDSVRVRGVVGQFNGLATLYADTLIYEGSGFDTQEPVLVQEMGEETESQVVRLKCVKLLDPAQWTNDFPFFDVMVDYGAGQVQIRIDANTNLFGTEPPMGTFGVAGIGGQYDIGMPLLDGYTLMPRSLDDLTEPVFASFSVPEDLEVGTPVTLENLSQGAGSFQWSFGNGVFSNDEAPELVYDEAGSYNIFLTAVDPNQVCADQASVTVNVANVDAVQEDGWDVSLWPNPAQDVVQIRVPHQVDWTAHDVAGRVIGAGTWPAGTHMLDVSEWAPGSYAISVRSEGRQVAATRFQVVRP